MDGSGCGLFVNTWIRDALFALILISVAWAVRSSLPSDLWKRSQPLTLRATVDVVVEDRWVLPHTVDDRPLAKPPLINWLSAPVVEAFGTAWSHRVVPALGFSVHLFVHAAVGPLVPCQRHGGVLRWRAVGRDLAGFQISAVGPSGPASGLGWNVRDVGNRGSDSRCSLGKWVAWGCSCSWDCWPKVLPFSR